jgi:hypothetical protein
MRNAPNLKAFVKVIGWFTSSEANVGASDSPTEYTRNDGKYGSTSSGCANSQMLVTRNSDGQTHHRAHPKSDVMRFD